MQNDRLLKHPASSEEVNPPLIWKVHTSWNFPYENEKAVDILRAIAYSAYNLFYQGTS